MHYVAYLDEFGHVGPYISRTDSKHKTSPVFGLAGILLPADQVREFAIHFYKLKCNLLAWDLQNNNPNKIPPYQWEKKGSAVYTVQNVEKYNELRKATNRLINRIKKCGGHIFYTGEHKIKNAENHNSTEIFKRQLLQAVKKIDRFCMRENSTFIILLDEQDAGNEWREKNVEACTLAMFEDASQKCRSLIEPPVQGESHLFQTLQCADWICGLIGRLAALKAEPIEYKDWNIFSKYFFDRIENAAIDESSIEELLPMNNLINRFS